MRRRALFAATHADELPGRSSLLPLGYFVAGVAMMPVWIWAARRFGAERAYSWACLRIALVVGAYWLVPAGSLGLLALVGFGTGTQGTSVDEDARTGLRLAFAFCPAICYGAAYLVLRRMMKLQRRQERAKTVSR